MIPWCVTQTPNLEWDGGGANFALHKYNWRQCKGNSHTNVIRPTHDESALRFIQVRIPNISTYTVYRLITISKNPTPLPCAPIWYIECPGRPLVCSRAPRHANARLPEWARWTNAFLLKHLPGSFNRQDYQNIHHPFAWNRECWEQKLQFAKFAVFRLHRTS